ncbi:MAG TPA: polya polymerase, partial [Desulfovibrio sp.]|nr:polya polymerase [Desulfovibrio sp.]
MSQSPEKIAAPTVITAHANADFDALAAMIAASKLYPDSVLVFPGSQEKNLRNFYIQSTTYLFNFRNFKDIDVDSVRRLVVVDTRQKSRLAHVQPLLDNPRVEIHAFDHHPDSEEDVAATRSVVKSWGSTTAILAAEMRERGLTPLPEEATVMGLGLFEDTGSFAFDSTTPEDFEAAAWLRRHGMDVNVISDLLSRDLDSEQVKILGELLETATTQEINGVAVVMTEASTENFVGDFAFLVHKFMDMENIRVLFALGRMGDRIHLVARSRSADVDVGAICTALGGGGHPYAASATIKNKTLSEVKNELFALLYSHVHSQMVVETLMSKPPVVIGQDQPMKDAVALMTRFGLKGVPVVAVGGMECVGLLEHKTAD